MGQKWAQFEVFHQASTLPTVAGQHLLQLGLISGKKRTHTQYHIGGINEASKINSTIQVVVFCFKKKPGRTLPKHQFAQASVEIGHRHVDVHTRA